MGLTMANLRAIIREELEAVLPIIVESVVKITTDKQRQMLTAHVVKAVQTPTATRQKTPAAKPLISRDALRNNLRAKMGIDPKSYTMPPAQETMSWGDDAINEEAASPDVALMQESVSSALPSPIVGQRMPDFDMIDPTTTDSVINLAQNGVLNERNAGPVSSALVRDYSDVLKRMKRTR